VVAALGFPRGAGARDGVWGSRREGEDEAPLWASEAGPF
jgi:hypothetical protein